MFFIGVLFSVVAIGFLCWLLFTLAVFALPAFAGVAAGIWAYHTGAGWIGGIIVGFIAAGLTFGVGQLLLAFARPLWLRLAVAFVFVVPAALAGTDHHPGLKATLVVKRWKKSASFTRSLQRMMDDISIGPRDMATVFANERQICR